MISIMWAKLRSFAIALLVAIFWLSVWTLGFYIANQTITQFLPLPYPWEVAVSLWRMMSQLSFWQDVAASLFRVFLGFVLALASGSVLAVLTTRFSVLHALISPIMAIFRAVPVVSFIYLAFLWIAPNEIPVLIVFLMVLPLVWENLRQGILHTDRNLLEMARVFRVRPFGRFTRIWVPSVWPYFLAALSTGFGFAWKAGIAVEVICTTGNSIGAQIASSKGGIEYADVFASTAMVVLLSMALEWLLRRLFGKGVAK